MAMRDGKSTRSVKIPRRLANDSNSDTRGAAEARWLSGFARPLSVIAGTRSCCPRWNAAGPVLIQWFPVFATVLGDLCDAVLEARKTVKHNYQQEHIAKRCELLVRGLARVGIIALVDEATGYQRDTARLAVGLGTLIR
jgi:hypothetical protein